MEASIGGSLARVVQMTLWAISGGGAKNMNPITGTLRSKISFGAVIVLLMSLSFAGSASAIYLNDAAKPERGRTSTPIPATDSA